MIAIGYGTYDFSLANTTNQDAKDAKTGMICIFSLKNTTHPEYTFETDSGVMSLDFHPQHPSLLCCGLYDGTVLVYDVRSKSASPLFASTNPKTKHTDPVWQVTWQRDQPEKNLNFFSISSDGRVTNWIMNKTELINEEVVELKLAPQEDSDEDEEAYDDDTMVGLAGGSCFDFNLDEQANMFIVGTEEGGLHSYSKSVGSAFLRNFQGHHMAVYAVSWNPFHPGIFLSCGADWTVKLWEVNNSEPVMTFDLQCAVSDITWAPFSSTVFAVGTVDAKIRVYDLSVDKHKEVGMHTHRSAQKSSSQHITHLSFNPAVPILSVGFDTGTVMIIKLSGSLQLHKDLNDIDRVKELLRLDDLMIINDEQGTIAGQRIREEQERIRKAEEAAAAAKAAAAEKEDDN
jgi:dynein intermediate chain 1